MLFFGVGIPIILWRLFSPAHGIVLSPRGLLFQRMFGFQLVLWEQIEAAELFESKGSLLLGIRVSDPGEVFGSWWLLGWSKLNRLFFDYDLCYPAQYLLIRPEIAFGAVLYYLDRPGARKQIGTPHGLRELQSALSS